VPLLGSYCSQAVVCGCACLAAVTGRGGACTRASRRECRACAGLAQTHHDGCFDGGVQRAACSGRMRAVAVVADLIASLAGGMGD